MDIDCDKSILECPICRILLRRKLPVDFCHSQLSMIFFSFVFVLSFSSWSRRGHQVVEETFCTYLFLALLIFSERSRHLGWWRLFCWLWEDDVWLHWDWDGGLEDGLVEGSQDRSNLFNKSLRNGADNFLHPGYFSLDLLFLLEEDMLIWPCAPEPQAAQTLISAGRDTGGFWNLEFSVICILSRKQQDCREGKAYGMLPNLMVGTAGHFIFDIPLPSPEMGTGMCFVLESGGNGRYWIVSH